jgi:hypothetical protein
VNEGAAGPDAAESGELVWWCPEAWADTSRRQITARRDSTGFSSRRFQEKVRSPW